MKPGSWKRQKVSVELQGSQQEGLNYLVGRTSEFWPRAKGNGRFEIVNAFLEVWSRADLLLCIFFFFFPTMTEFHDISKKEF